MATRFTFVMFRFLILVLLIAKSHQSTGDRKHDELARCYKGCQENFTENPINNVTLHSEQIKEACHKGCRFFSLILHASLGFNPITIYNAIEEGCVLSCSESYTDLDKVTGCNFGCKSFKTHDSTDVIDRQSPKTHYSVVITQTTDFYPVLDDPDEALIDLGLKKQLQGSFNSFSDSKPKIPEIHFQNLPISNEEIRGEFSESQWKCLSHLFKGFCQVCHHKAKYHQEKEEKETLAKQNLLVNVEILEKSQLLEVKCESTE